MNKQRRKELNAVSSMAYNVCKSIEHNSDKMMIIEQLKQVVDDLKNIKMDEEYYMYNIPENFQGSCRYDIAEEACDNMETAISYLEDTIDDEQCTLMEIKHTLELSIKYINLATA